MGKIVFILAIIEICLRKHTGIELLDFENNCSHYNIGFLERDIKPQWGTITCQTGWLLSKSLQAINVGEGVEKREPSYTVGGNAN